MSASLAPSLDSAAIAGAAAMAGAIVGQSDAMRRAIQRAERFAQTGLPVLLVGATGTGKDLLARHIHRLSARKGEFVDINCGALPKDMVESLLYGHRRGAFTGAVADTPGLVTRASAGTLFLDELCSLSTDAQVKLLRVLETGQVRALGETKNVPVDFRLVSAVQEDFGPRLERGAFREDLYHRIAGVVVHLPRLSERAGDIALLAAHFAARYGRILGTSAVPLLEQHSWPGNVRELRTVIDRAVFLTEDEALDAGTLTEALSQGSFRRASDGGLAPTAGNRRLTLLGACAANGWQPLRIASALGVSRATLYRKLRASGIELRRFGKSHQSRESQSV